MESLTFQLFSLHNTVNYRGGNDVLSLFGRTGTGNSVRLDVEGFRPYIFLEMDYTKWRESVWSPLSFVMVHDSLRRRYDEMETQEEMCTLLAHRMRKPPIMPTLTCEDGFGIKEVPLDGAPRPFLRLEFRNWHQLQKLKRTMREFAIITAESLALGSLLSNVLDGRVGTEAERQVLVPLIRALEDCRALKFKTFEGCYDCGSMFLIHYNVKPSGWLCVSPVTALACAPDTRVREFSCSYTASLKVEEGNGPPLSQVRILSYDIEAVPFAVGDGTTLFPQPERDPICTIGIACYEYGTEALEMHALSVGDTEEGWSRADDPSNDDYDPSKVTLHTFTTENDMLMFFASFIREYDPDFISGFNILNFDNYYTLKRASYKCSSGEALWWGRTKKECVPEKRFTSSNQLGGREFWDVRIVGREWFDLYNITKIDHKLSSYKLDSVAEHFLGTKKIEISYDDIPTMCRTPAGRKRLAVYCVKDAFLPLQLCIKLCKLQNAVSLSYVTGAPINHILNRGQQIRTLNLIVRHVRTHKPRLYVPDRTEENTEGFQGAVVIDPIKGFYTRPVVVLDFASLYPSTMIANNMCFSTKISRVDAEKHGLQHGKDFLAIRDFKREGTSFEFIDKPSDTCFLMSDRRRGVLPEILASLLSARKAEKKLMKKCKEGSLAYGVHNGNQLALKISANSVYGFTGASRGVLTDPEISSAVTRRGRAMTNEASFVAETAFEGTRTVYGDSVAGRTPLLLKRNGEIVIERICDLKLDSNPTYTWTERGWTEIKNIICHRLSPEKKMLRIFTHTGMVDCTSDHSLVNSDGHAMFPSSIVCGETALMQSFPAKWVGEVQTVDMTCTERLYPGCDDDYYWHEKKCTITPEFGSLFGFFFCNGSMNTNVYERNAKWQLHHDNYDVLLRYRQILKRVFNEFEWPIVKTTDSPSEYTLVPDEHDYGLWKMTFAKKWRQLFYDKRDEIVPKVILNSPVDVRSAFHETMCGGRTSLLYDSQITAQSVCTLLKSLGYTVLVEDSSDGYLLRMYPEFHLKTHNVVQKVIELKHELFVYDLTTDNHHFHAGIGNIVVHNTDSIFVELGESICPTEGKTNAEVLAKAQEVGEMLSARITKQYRAPNDLEYEKTFKPFLLKGKKRYAGLKHEPGKKTKMDIKGFECVRRDFAPFVVSTQQKIFELLVGQEDIEGSVEYTKGVIHKLLQGEMPISELIMSKKLTQAPEKYKTKAIHVVLAERLKKELPETVAPKVGDRIPYIVRTGSEKLCMRGVQPEEIQSGKFQADLFYYMTKQAYEPFKRIFELVGDGYVTSVFEEYEKYKARITEMARKRKREEKEAATRRQLRVRDIRSFFGNRK